MIDYLLLAGFAAASVYTIFRLFVGLRNSPPAQVRMDVADEGNLPTDAETSRRAEFATRAPWQSRKPAREEGLEQ